MLQRCAQLGITLIDYEYLTDDNHVRLIAFGRWAGIVGAYNTIYTFGLKTGLFTLKRACQCFDHHDLFKQLEMNKEKLAIGNYGLSDTTLEEFCLIFI